MEAEIESLKKERDFLSELAQAGNWYHCKTEEQQKEIEMLNKEIENIKQNYVNVSQLSFGQKLRLLF